MTCPRCQAERTAEARFCEECGARFEVACPRCGQPVAAGKKFCWSCGAALAEEAGRFASPEVYTPKHLAEKILTTKRTLEGERKQVTVLFADMKGSMELIADRDPEEASRYLDAVLERMMEAVHRYEGTVNQVMGDGIMALFGAPLAHEDHAVRAAYAALRMQDSVKRYAEDMQREAGIPIQIRVGLNSGDVVVRSIGNDLHMDYTAVGQCTHLAARMEQMAMAGSILMTAASLHLAEGYVQTKALGRVKVKGLADAVEAYELTGVLATRTRLQAAMSRGPTAFVVREAEMEELGKAMEQAGAGRGQIVAVVGEAGVGKSRVLWEFRHSPRAADWLVLEADCVSFARLTPYRPVSTLLQSYFRIDESDPAYSRREKVDQALRTLGPVPDFWRSALCWLLGADAGTSEWEALDPGQRRHLTQSAVTGLFSRVSIVQPLMLVVEDLHWVDASTNALLDTLITSLPTKRILLLVSYRPEFQHAWGSRTYCHVVRVDPLPPPKARELLRALLGDRPRPAGLEDLLITRTEGNPLFLQESVRALVETLGSEGEQTALDTLTARRVLEIAPTIQAVLAARIDRLDPAAKRLLQVASVIGKDVPLNLLEAVSDEPGETLGRSLAELQAAEFLYETRLFPMAQYTFHHALTHEVTHGSLLHSQQRLIHARIVAAIEKLYSDRLHEHVEELAEHAFRAELWEPAVTWLRDAGTKAFAHSAHHAAVASLEKALIALARLPETPERLRLAVDLRFDLRNSLFAIGDHGRAAERLREAEELAGRLEDPRRQAWAACYFMMHALLTGESQRTLEHGRRALEIGTALADPALRVVANLGVGQALHALGQYEQAIVSLSSGLAVLDGSGKAQRFGMSSPPAIACLTWLAWCHAERGEFARGMAHAEEGLRIADSAKDAWGRTSGHFALGLVCLRRRDLKQAVTWLARGLEICETFGLRTWLPPLASALGYARMLDGQLAAAVPLLERAVAESEAQRVLFRHSLRIAWLAEARLRAGDPASAAQLAHRALDLARKHEERGHEAYALWLLGEVSADAAAAEARYREALALATTLGMRPLEAQCHLSIGERLTTVGRGEAARHHMLLARTLFTDLGIDPSSVLASVHQA